MEGSPDGRVWKEFGWCGIGFMAPGHWEIGKIGPRYLLLEEESGPVLEFKTGRVKGALSHRAQLSRLSSLQNRRLRKTIRECPPPKEWKRSLDKYQAVCFSWQGSAISGIGALLHCPDCGKATMVQFYRIGSNGIEKLSGRVLETFRDHPKNNRVVWSLFDIRAVIPEKFQLAHHRFDAGEFELTLVSAREKITLFRWGLASILIREGGLAHFVRTRFSDYGWEPRPLARPDWEGVEWERNPDPSPWRRWVDRSKAKGSFQRFRLWHLEEKNRILGVKVEAKNEIEGHFFNEVCAGYESV